jgi:hypothetical protein
MNTTKETRRSNWHQQTALYESPQRKKSRLKIWCDGNRLWVVQFCLECSRENHYEQHHLWREAGICIILAILRMVGVRYV